MVLNAKIVNQRPNLLIRKKNKAAKINQKDLFSSKFFVEDFLEDINTATLLEQDTHSLENQSIQSRSGFMS